MYKIILRVMFKGTRILREEFQKIENYYKLRLIDEKMKQRNKKLELNEKDLSLKNYISDGEWENNISCNYCGSTQNRPYLISKEIDWYGQVFRLIECLNCHLVYADPRPIFDSVFNFYLKSEWSKKMFVNKYTRPNIMNYHRNIIKEILTYNNNARSLFDVGTGAGTLLLEGRKMGLKASGNEINKAGCDWLSKKGIKIYNIPTIDLKIKNSFDIITMLDYIEHTYTPFNDLKWAYSHLNPDGLLYLKTLYLNCPTHKLMKDKWHLFGEGHLHYYYPFVLTNMIHDTGLEIIKQNLNDQIVHIIAKKKLVNI